VPAGEAAFAATRLAGITLMVALRSSLAVNAHAGLSSASSWLNPSS
jgi:hypothetical protein